MSTLISLETQGKVAIRVIKINLRIISRPIGAKIPITTKITAFLQVITRKMLLSRIKERF